MTFVGKTGPDYSKDIPGITYIHCTPFNVLFADDVTMRVTVRDEEMQGPRPIHHIIFERARNEYAAEHPQYVAEDRWLKCGEMPVPRIISYEQIG